MPTVKTVTPDRSYRITLGRNAFHVEITDQLHVYLVNDVRTIDLSGSIPMIDGRRDHTGRSALHIDACNYPAQSRTRAKTGRTS